MAMTRLTNWAGNITFDARRLHRPATLDELRDVVAGTDRLRVLGSGHSFNRITDTAGDLVSLRDLPPTIDIDADRRTVTVGGGLRYGDIVARLHEQGWALHNLASLPHISVAGAVATATHGSGDRNGNLATAVSALEMVTADGDVVRASRAEDGDRFAGMVVALGALGVVTSLTLDLVPAFDVRQWVYDDLPFDAFNTHVDEIFASAYSVSLFTDWTAPRFMMAWLKRRVDGQEAGAVPERWMGATLADGPRHPVPGVSPEYCTEQGGVPGPSHARLPHFRLEFTPSTGEELQSEYMVPREGAVEAVEAVYRAREVLAPVLQTCELRTVAADDLWLSLNHRRDSLGLHFTWIKDDEAVAPAVAALERQLAPLAARPHWGKVFAMEPDVVASRYDRMTDFRNLMGAYDPGGKFRNELIDRYLPPG
jgi:xylitol oxidase